MQLRIIGYKRFGFRGAPGPTAADGRIQYHGSAPPLRVFPLVAHINASPCLARLYHEIDAVTPKRIIIADASGLEKRSREIMEGLHCASWRDVPDTILITIDSNECCEGIIAHEFMHVWLDLVEGFEDHREYSDVNNGRSCFQVISAQSFVIDCKIQEKLKERGFDLRLFTDDIVDALYEGAVALEVGCRPRNRTEAAIGARLLARPWATPELYEFTDVDWEKILFARRTFERYDGACVRLADHFVQAFRKHSYSSKDEAVKLIDECLKLQFRFLREPFSIEHDLIVQPDSIRWTDKFPSLLPNVPPHTKHDILRRLIRDGWPSGTRVITQWTDMQTLAVKFVPPSEKFHHAPRGNRSRGVEATQIPFFEYDEHRGRRETCVSTTRSSAGS